MELLLTSDGDTMPNEETIAATFLHALLAGGKEAVTFLSPMVYGWNNEGDGGEAKDDDKEDDEDEDLTGNL